MEPFRNHPGSQTTIFLAGCILSCLLQLVPAQENLTVVSVPEHPIEGQSILLYAKNLREGFDECEWMLPSRKKISSEGDTKVTPRNTSQVVVVHQNCSLNIKNLKPSDQGEYRIQATFFRGKQQEGRGPEIYTGSIFLIICDVNQIRINVKPASPVAGQAAVLTPQGIPKSYTSCRWKQKTFSGVEKEFQDSGQEPSKEQNQQQKIKQTGCSLQLPQLTSGDSGNYSIYVEAHSDQEPEPGKGKENRAQMKCYRSQTQLKVGQNGSASMKYSAGIIAGALLGSLTWTSSLSLVPLLFSMLSSFFPEC